MQHLEYFRIQNFKRFDNLEVKDIGQFNLIVGDNNVGKTSLLEALLLENDEQKLQKALRYIVSQRLGLNGKDIVDESALSTMFLKRGGRSLTISFKHNKKGFRFKIQDGNFRIVVSDIDKKRFFSRVIEVKAFYKIKNKNFIPFSASYGSDLTEIYSSSTQIKRSRKREVIENLKLFIPNIDDLLVVDQGVATIGVFENNYDDLLPISYYGDGVNKLMRILLHIPACENERLMIDEIDTGIHFSRFKEFWKIILKMAKLYNVQLFATTHNPDCLTYYKEAFEELEEESFREKARIFKMVEMKDGNVNAYPLKFESFSQAIDLGTELRLK